MALGLKHLDHIFGQLLIVSHQLGNIERRQEKLARRLEWLVHTVKVAFEEARDAETGNGLTDIGSDPERRSER